MKDTVLIINGSPRRNGNSSFLAGKVLDGLRKHDPDIKTEMLDLRTMRIKPCRGCDSCRSASRRQPYCVIRDDMEQIYDKLVDCRALVLISPIYWFNVTAQMKAFIDRFYGLSVEKMRSLSGKPVGIVLVYGDKDPYISGAVNAIRTLEDVFRYTKSRITGIVYGTANDRGDAEKNEELCAGAEDLGRDLLSGVGI
jgi:multimeric flavodoxin WrbA